jgi:hypothetical protein
LYYNLYKMSTEATPPLSPQEQKALRLKRNARYKEMIEDAELLARLKKAYRDQAVYEAERLEAYAQMAQLQGALEGAIKENEQETAAASTAPNPEQPAQDPNPESAPAV